MTPTVAILISLLATSPAEVRNWPDAGGFEILQLDDTCALTAEYPLAGRSPITLAVIQGTDTPTLVMASRDWSNQVDAQYDLTFELGRSVYSGTGRGVLVEYVKKGFKVSLGSDFLNEFAAAPGLYVTHGDAVVANLSLNGTTAAVAAMRRCSAYVQQANTQQAARERRIDYIAPDPFAPAAGTEPEPTAPPARQAALITNPTWNRRPGADFPERASSRGIRFGSTSLECRTNPNGSITDCEIISETPAGAGFGQAALAGARQAQLTPRSVDGVAPGGKVRFTTQFSLD